MVKKKKVLCTLLKFFFLILDFSDWNSCFVNSIKQSIRNPRIRSVKNMETLQCTWNGDVLTCLAKHTSICCILIVLCYFKVIIREHLSLPVERKGALLALVRTSLTKMSNWSLWHCYCCSKECHVGRQDRFLKKF